MQNRLVSVIIPIYNLKPEYFQLCLQSVCKQSYSYMEILVTDDGSDEMLSKQYQRICAQDERVHYAWQENTGCSTARNSGLQRAKGTFITFVDADDILLDDFLEQAINDLETYHLDFVIGGQCTETKRPCECLEEKITILDGDKTLLAAYLQDRTGLPILANCSYTIGSGPCARIGKADILKTITFPVGIPLNEDTIWNLYVLNACERVGISNQTWYEVRQTRASATRRYRPDCREETEKQLAIVKAYLNEHFRGALPNYYSRVTMDFGLVMHLGVMNKSADNSVTKQYAEIKDMLHCDPWKEAFAKVDAQQLNRNRRVLVWLARRHCFTGIWLVSWLRTRQLRKEHQ